MKSAWVMVLLLCTACGEGEKAPAAQEGTTAAGHPPAIYTVNYPLAWMARALAGDAARVVFPTPEGVDPAFWQPDTETVLKYQQADLVLLNGAGYARWIARVSLPGSRLVDTSANYRERLIAVDAGPVHSHGPTGEHSHGAVAFTTWLDLELAQQQLQATASALQQLLPEQAARIEQRRSELQQVLHSGDTQLQRLGQQLGETPVLYSHPVYQYLQRRYQLNGRALHWEPDQAPSELQWSELEEILRSHPAQLMLWEAQPLPEVAERLATLGIRVVVFMPMGNRPQQGDFEAGMAANIAALAQP